MHRQIELRILVMEVGVVGQWRVQQQQHWPGGAQLLPELQAHVDEALEGLRRRDCRSHQAGRSNWVLGRELIAADLSSLWRINPAVHVACAALQACPILVQPQLTKLKIC